jgi:hypothetical protein
MKRLVIRLVYVMCCILLSSCNTPIPPGPKEYLLRRRTPRARAQRQTYQPGESNCVSSVNPSSDTDEPHTKKRNTQRKSTQRKSTPRKNASKKKATVSQDDEEDTSGDIFNIRHFLTSLTCFFSFQMNLQ